MKLLPIIWVTSAFRRRRANSPSRAAGAIPAPTPVDRPGSAPRQQQPPADRARTAILAAVTAAVIVGGTATASAVLGRTSDTYTAAPTGTTSTSPTYSPQATAQPTPAAPTIPATYGDIGAAKTYANRLGYDSMSAACAAGIEWTCHITHIKPGAVPSIRDVYVGVAPYDADAVAQTVLENSPDSVTQVHIKHVPYGRTVVVAPTIGSAGTPWK